MSTPKSDRTRTDPKGCYPFVIPLCSLSLAHPLQQPKSVLGLALLAVEQGCQAHLSPEKLVNKLMAKKMALVGVLRRPAVTNARDMVVLTQGNAPAGTRYPSR